MSVKYDTIGINYAELRKPDPRIARVIEGALGSAQTVLNVGAGTGSYEPADRSVTAVEPSARDDPQAQPGGRTRPFRPAPTTCLSATRASTPPWRS